MGGECASETEGSGHVRTATSEGRGNERCRRQQRHHLLVASTSLGQKQREKASGATSHIQHQSHCELHVRRV